MTCSLNYWAPKQSELSLRVKIYSRWDLCGPIKSCLLGSWSPDCSNSPAEQGITLFFGAEGQL